jgi:iron-sulfur cluster insertion protein
MITITDSASKKIQEVLQEENDPSLKIRIFVQGGGCSGLQYGFSFDNVKDEDDIELVENNISLLVDIMSFQFLTGAEIDYVEDVYGAQFKIKNPNAKATCSCGNSFSAGPMFDI